MSWKGRAVLVTGAGGFVGSHLVEALVNHGARVRAFVRYNSRGNAGLLRYLPPSTIREVEIVAGDLRDPEAINGAASSVEVIFHLGALVSIPYSYLNPREIAETNILGTVNILMAARRQGVPRVIHTSTSEVYGTAISVPIGETHPLQGQSPYAASKIGADKIAQSFHRSYGLSLCTVRPFNVYGPRQSDRAVIPTIISQALTRTEIRLGATWTTRDYTYVTDTVKGFLKAGERADLVGQEINLGSNREISIIDLARMILKILNRELPIIEDSRRMRPQDSEVGRLRADNTLARMLLGWTPLVSLEEGLAETIRWVEEHPELYEPSAYRI